ncbi:hypothetical protein GN156_11180 [bacterium LRH843]|nr:hypothetical protein [bacterium LRH843]
MFLIEILISLSSLYILSFSSCSLSFRNFNLCATKVGGDHNVLARTMNFEFLRPVFTGDTITCDVKIEKYERDEKNRTVIIASFLCENQHEKEVLKGNFSGVIL